MQAPLCAVVGLAVDQSGLLNLSEGGYSLVLRLTANGTIERIAGNTAATNIGDAGPALQASLAGGQGFSPETVAFDPAGNLFLAEPGLNYIRKVTKTAYQVTVLPGDIIVSGSTAQSQTLTVKGNFDEPFPYAVRVSVADGGSWLSANRVTGFTGESIKVSINPAGLARGTYQGTVLVTVSVPVVVSVHVVELPILLPQ